MTDKEALLLTIRMEREKCGRLREERDEARKAAVEMWNKAHEWAETGDGCTWRYLEDYVKGYEWLQKRLKGIKDDG